MYVSEYISYLIGQTNPHRIQILTSTLESLVVNNIVPSRLVVRTMAIFQVMVVAM